MAGTHAPHSTALAMPFIEDEWWSAENEGRMVDLSNCVQVTSHICHSHIYLLMSKIVTFMVDNLIFLFVKLLHNFVIHLITFSIMVVVKISSG